MSNQNKTEEKERIHFDAVVGNPPYQVTKSDTVNIQVWQHFVKVANLITNKWTSLIHPGRWVVPKPTMKPVRDDLLEQGLEKFNLFYDSTSLFPNTAIDGGVTITNFKKGYKGNIDYYIGENKFGIYDKNKKFTSNFFEDEVLTKLINIYDDNISKRIRGKIGSFGSGDFGFDKGTHTPKLKKDSKKLSSPIKVWATPSTGKGQRFEWFYLEKSDIPNIDKEIISTRKVMIDKKGNAIKVNSGNGANIINNIPEIVPKNAIAGFCLFCIPENDTDYELKLIQSLFCTKTARFLMSLTQKDLYVRGFENIPDYTYFIDDMKDPKYNNKMFENKLGLLTDEYFYKKFNFSQELINHIESHISAKELV